MSKVKAVPPTQQERFEDAVSVLRTEPFDAKAILLVDDILKALMIAWPYVHRWVEIPLDAVVDDPWEMVQFDRIEWTDLAGLDSCVFELAVMRIRAMGLVYPDGTYPESVETYLDNLAMGRVGE